MAKTFELAIRNGRWVYYTAAATVDETFERDLFDAYRQFYPDAPDDEALFYRIVQGLFQGIADNIRNHQLTPPPLPDPRFEIVGREVRSLPTGESHDQQRDAVADASATATGAAEADNG